jgi:arabinan endo-1,5-alpha-L-arabinosidase
MTMNSQDIFSLRRGDVRVRDPFIVADAETKLYRMYVQSGNCPASGFQGVAVYSSPDLARWSGPRPVLVLPPERGAGMVWAPEVHRWQGKWHLFVTLTLNEAWNEPPPVRSSEWPAMRRRGTHVFRADSLLGPFEPLRRGPLTPPDWMALDGTLHMEDGVPWLVFCHEWVQVVDGRMMAVRLTPGLDAPADEPRELFRASAAPGCVPQAGQGLVTDGPFLHRAASGALLMLWSTFIPGQGYSLLSARSASGGVMGPWLDQRVVAGDDGGHGMLLRSFGGEWLLALHRPNSSNRERLHLFAVHEDGDRLRIAAAGADPQKDRRAP